MALPLDPHLEEHHRELAGRTRQFGERHLRGAAGDEEDPSGRAAEVVAQLGEAGLLAWAVPPPFGAFDARSAWLSPSSSRRLRIRSPTTSAGVLFGLGILA